MKIGILTQPLHRNYGGALQNWALQQVLIALGHQPEMIYLGYYQPKYGLVTKILRCMSVLKTIAAKAIGRGKNRMFSNPLSRGYSVLPLYMDHRFIDRIAKSRKCYDNAELLRVVDRGGYDAFIVGSDQVWRQKYSPRIETYFIDFLADDDKRPRIAYAASFGVRNGYINEDKMPVCRRLLQRFDAISVRENEGVDIVRNDFGIDNVTRTLDPTLLLDAEYYRTLIDKKDVAPEPKLEAYILDNDVDKSCIIADVAALTESDVHQFSAENQSAPCISMSAWLASFSSARFIVTDSFHGCVFSILFNKPFIAITNQHRGVGRIITLLKEFGLENRLVGNYQEFQQRSDAILEDIDYVSVNERLSLNRNKSIEWLKNALS